MSSLAPSPVPVVRRPDHLDVPSIPRWWLHDNPYLTHFANGLNLIFPAGERFFIRSVKRYVHRVDDPELLERVKAFYGQEAEHGRQHARVTDILRKQGYDVDAFLGPYERMYPVLERWLPGRLALATTSALEHLTASLGHAALTDDFLDGAHPVMRDLWRWHAAEEIEHKAVAFDVMRAVGITWVERCLGMVFGLGQLLYQEKVALRILLRQEDLSPKDQERYAQEARAMRGGHQRKLFSRAILDWLKPGFHPNDVDDAQLAADYFAAHPMP